MTDYSIEQIQSSLNAHGDHLEVDGILGPDTEAAIIAFQAANGLEQDGIVGPLTSAKLFASNTPTPAPSTAGTRAQGLDIYHWDDFPNLSGIDFVFLKATEGAFYTDSMFVKRWADLKQSGVIRGAYHFLRSDQDPTAQAEYFAQVMGQLDDGDLPPVLDLETEDGMNYSAIEEGALAFLQKVQALTGRLPIIYSDPSFLNDECNFDAIFAKYPLWIADPSRESPRVPAPWTNWTFFQYSFSGVDKDCFNGSVDDLKAFIAASKVN